MPTSLRDAVAVLEEIAPPHLAEAWDNVGLLVGDPGRTVGRALLTIDYTADVAAEAREAKCDLVVAYHPPIFRPLKSFTSGSARLAFEAARDGVALYSPHTALDAVEGGPNDALADVLVLQNRRPLRVAEAKPTRTKLVTFAPADAADKVADALFAAGAGRIGDYAQCSFRTPGTGTFEGGAGASPTVGQAGAFERVDEMRVEVVVPNARLADACAALRAAHPYEEPALDLYPLAGEPRASVGQGRVGDVPDGATGDMLVERVKRELEVDHVLVAGDLTRVVRRAACAAGAGGELLVDALAARCDLFLTGELRHHDALRAVAGGTAVIAALHSNSERVTLRRLRDRLAARLPAVTWTLSARDHDPFSIR